MTTHAVAYYYCQVLCYVVSRAACLLLLWGVHTSTSFAQADTTFTSPASFTFTVDHWGTKDGLPTWKINCLFEDSRNVLWLGTKSMVMGFDGYSFKSFHLSNGEKRKKWAEELFEDIHSNIWIRCIDKEKIDLGQDIHVLNPFTDSVVGFQRYLTNQGFDLSAFSDSWEVVGVNQIILLIHESGKGLIYKGKDSHFVDLPVGSFRYLIGSAQEPLIWAIDKNNGIYLIDSTFQKLYSLPPEKEVSIWQDTAFGVWMAHYSEEAPMDFELAHLTNSGIHQFDPTQLPPIAPVPSFHTLYDLSDVFVNSQGLTWIRTPGSEPNIQIRYQGQKIVEDLDEELTKTYNVALENHFFFPKNDDIWMANTGGLFKINIIRNPFTTYLTGLGPNYSMRAMTLVDGRYLYANSYAGGKIVDLGSSPPKTMVAPEFAKHGTALGLLVEDDYIWIGRHESPVTVIPTDQPEKSKDLLFNYDPNILRNVCNFLRVSPNRLLMGTSTGLFQYKPSNDSIELLNFEGTPINCFYATGKDIWLGSDGKLLLVDTTGRLRQTVDTPSPLTSITFIHRDKEGIFWLATHGDGMIRWDHATGHFTPFSTGQGLPDDYVHAIYEDDYNHLWLSTNYGLMSFDKSNNNIVTYFEGDGLPHHEFNLLSHYHADDGQLFFGSLNGIVSFYPKEVHALKKKDSRFSLKVVEALAVNTATGATSNKTMACANRGRLDITPDEKFLTIKFSPMVFRKEINVDYAWKLENHHNDWVMQRENTIRLHHLSYGNHLLQIKSRIIGNEWSEEELRLTLFVQKPFYLRTWFVMFCCLVGLIAVWQGIRFRTRHLKREKWKLEKEVSARTQQIESDKKLIEQQARELKELDQLKSRFFANVTHELRTPLALILAPLQDLLGKQKLQKTVTSSLSKIEKQAQKLQSLIDEIMDLSKLEANKVSLENTAVELYPLIRRLVFSFKSYAGYRDIELELDYRASDKLEVLLDINKFEKIINNLLTNAIKFSRPGGRVTCCVKRLTNNLQLEVTDIGKGIHPDDLPFIFDRYFQTQQPDAPIQGGMGIGLALSREYARLFGGQLTAESRLGEGSTFIFTFPVKEVDSNFISEKVPRIKPHPEATTTTVNPFKKHTVLIVEDNPEMREYLESILSVHYNLKGTNNGISALKMLEEQSFDLVVSDIMMPEMDGFQLLEKIKQQERWRAMPVVLLTAREDIADKLQALRMGVDDYLTKPFLSEELSIRIANILQRYEDRKEYIRQRQLELEKKEDYWLPEVQNPLSEEEVCLEKLTSKVQQHLSDSGFTVKKLAIEMSVSERSLRSKVRTYTGMKPLLFIREVRLQKARHLLEQRTFPTVAEVCYAVGMSQPAYFSRLFKERFGRLPSSYL